MKHSYTPSAAELNRCTDDFGLVNLSRLHDVCLEWLWNIERMRAGSGRRTVESIGCLARRITAFLVRHQFAEHTATRWFWANPHAEYSLQLHAEGYVNASHAFTLAAAMVASADLKQRRVERITHGSFNHISR